MAPENEKEFTCVCMLVHMSRAAKRWQLMAVPTVVKKKGLMENGGIYAKPWKAFKSHTL